MLWIFERGEESQQLETRYDSDAAEYVLIIRGEDGAQQVERFTDPITFRTRLEFLERELEMEHWKPRGAPVFLRDGWKI